MVRHTGEDFVDTRGVAVATMLSLQASSINCAKLDTPQADRLTSDDNAAFSQEVFDITMAEIESVVAPNSVGNDIGWESVALVSIHPPILAI